MTTTTTIAQNALSFIGEAISKGLTVYVSTHTRVYTVSPKTAAKWAKAGIELFSIDATGALTMASGKARLTICTPSMCLVRITAQ